MANVNIDISVNNRDAQAKIDKLTRSTKEASKGFDRLSLSVKQSSGAFGSFVGNVAAIGFSNLISSLVSFGSSTRKVTGEIETLRTKFEVLTGSAGAANKAMQDLQKFAAETPFQFKDIGKAQQKLLSFGFSLDEVQDRLIDIGDVSAASGADIGELSLIFGQVRAAGKLTGERLLQFQERAIPIGPAIAKSLGVLESQVKDLVSEGKVDFKTFEAAFRSLNNTGEFAFGGMEKRSQTLEGRISTLKDNFALLQANIGSKLAPAFKALLSTVTSFIQKIQVSGAFTEFVETLSKHIPTAIEFAVDSFGFVINAVLNTIKTFNLLRAGVTTAVSVVIGAFTKMIDVYSGVVNALGLGDTALGKSLNKLSQFRTDVISSLDATATGFTDAAAEIQLSQDSVNESIDGSKKFILDAYAQEKTAAEAQAAAIAGSNEKKKTSQVELTQAQIEELQKRLEAEKKFQEQLEVARQAAAQGQAERYLFETMDFQFFNQGILAELSNFFTLKEQIEAEAHLKTITSETERKAVLLKLETDAQKRRLDAEIKNQEQLKNVNRDANKIIAEDNKQLAELQKNIDQTKVQDRKSTLSTISTLAQSNSKELAAIGKAAGIAQIAIDTPVAVSKALAAFPPPLNFIAAGAVGAAMAAQAAKIAGLNFETGGIVPGTSFTGDNVAANVNSGEMVLTRRQQSELFNMANGRSSGGQSQTINSHITVELDGAVVARAVSSQVANGLKLGEVV